jgi:threonine dehydrogenase-like Zn-dependent dehydrogenase
MKATVLYGPRDVRYEHRPDPTITKPTDAILRLSATCICGSDLWPYRGIGNFAEPPTPMGHEYCGIVEEVGKDVRNVKRGQFVVGSFATSDNTCVICRDGYQSSCVQREFMSTAQAPLLRVPLADGTLVPTRDVPPKELIPSLLATSDVLGTGWFAADAANVKPGKTAVVVGDGAVGLLAVLSAKQMGAERIIAMSRHESRQKLAREFGATDIVTERGMKESLASRNLRTASALILRWSAWARRNPCCRRSVRLVLADTSATLACRTGLNSMEDSCSSLGSICMAAQRRFAGTCLT